MKMTFDKVMKVGRKGKNRKVEIFWIGRVVVSLRPSAEMAEAANASRDEILDQERPVKYQQKPVLPGTTCDLRNPLVAGAHLAKGGRENKKCEIAKQTQTQNE